MDPLLFFKCLSEESRLKTLFIIHRLKEVCVCDLTLALDTDQPRISRNLAMLRNSGVLEGERRGKWVYYSFHAELPAWAMEVIKQSAAENADFYAEAIARLNKDNLAKCC